MVYFRYFSVVMAVVLASTLVPQAQAQLSVTRNGFSIPMQDTAGAILYREQRNFNLMQQQPSLFRPITSQDTAAVDEPVIIYEDGVIPHERVIQGVIVTPGGSVTIGAPQE